MLEWASMHYRIEHFPASRWADGYLRLVEVFPEGVGKRLCIYKRYARRREWMILTGTGLDVSVLTAGYCRECEEQRVIENFLEGRWTT